MPTLRAIIQRLRAGDVPREAWLYIVGDAKYLSLDTEAELGCGETDEVTYAEIDPPGFLDRGLKSTIDKDTLDDCIAWADRLAGKADDAAVADIVRYYIRFDSCPDKLNSPDPPSWDETTRLLDREFCDKLGQEDSASPCRHEGCTRGVVRFSVYCRRHHFEKIRGRSYPFED